MKGTKDDLQCFSDVVFWGVGPEAQQPVLPPLQVWEH